MARAPDSVVATGAIDVSSVPDAPRAAGVTAAQLHQVIMLENLTERLSRVVKGLRGQARLTDDNIQDALREVRLALLEADVALPVVRDFVAAVQGQGARRRRSSAR